MFDINHPIDLFMCRDREHFPNQHVTMPGQNLACINLNTHLYKLQTWPWNCCFVNLKVAPLRLESYLFVQIPWLIKHNLGFPTHNPWQVFGTMGSVVPWLLVIKSFFAGQTIASQKFIYCLFGFEFLLSFLSLAILWCSSNPVFSGIPPEICLESLNCIL